MPEADPQSDVSEYEAVYVFCYYGQLMTEQERLAYRHFAGTIKATHGRDDVAAQEEAKTGPSHLSKMLSDDPDVLRLARNGFSTFVLLTGQRILNEHRNEIVLNRCSRSGGVARTPTARQCRFCRHDWH